MVIWHSSKRRGYRTLRSLYIKTRLGTKLGQSHRVLTLWAWLRRCSCLVNLLPHMGQGKGLSPVWQRMCLFMIPFCLAVYGQNGHLWSFTGTTNPSPAGGERDQLFRYTSREQHCSQCAALTLLLLYVLNAT